MSSIILVRSTHLWEKYQWIRIWEAQKHADPADPDPDPQHWFSNRQIQQMFVDEIVFVVLVQVMNARVVHSEYT